MNEPRRRGAPEKPARRRGVPIASSTPANMATKPSDPDGPGVEEDTTEEDADARDREQHAPDQRGVVDARAHAADGRHEVGVAVIETALHLVEKSLLLLGKWHPDPSSPE